MSLKQQLRDSITGSGYSVRKVALDCGMTQPTLARWLSGEYASLNLADVQKLCDYFGMRLTRPRKHQHGITGGTQCKPEEAGREVHEGGAREAGTPC